MIDQWLIFLRITHVGSAMVWFGGAIMARSWVQRPTRWDARDSRSWIT